MKTDDPSEPTPIRRPYRPRLFKNEQTTPIISRSLNRSNSENKEKVSFIDHLYLNSYHKFKINLHILRVNQLIN